MSLDGNATVQQIQWEITTGRRSSGLARISEVSALVPYPYTNSSLRNPLREDWAKSQGFKQARAGTAVCPLRLVGKRCLGCSSNGTSDCGRYGTGSPAAEQVFDHPSLWLKGGRPEVFVSQPYGASQSNLRFLHAFCAEHDLRYWVLASPAWHNPGAVLHIELRRAT